MTTIGAYEAKTHLSRLLEDVARGKSFTITKHGKPVALLVPPPEARRPDVGQAISEWQQYQQRQDLRLGGLSLRELIEEGRR